MNDQEKHAIGYRLFKRVLAKQFSFRNIKNMEKTIENEGYSKDTGISKDKLLVFIKIALRETMEEEFVILGKKTEIGFKKNS
jgi:hypothetical protein